MRVPGGDALQPGHAFATNRECESGFKGESRGRAEIVGRGLGLHEVVGWTEV